MSLNIGKLKEAVNANYTSKVIFRSLTDRRRAAKVRPTDLRQFQYKLVKQGRRLNYEHYYDYWKTWEEAGAGSMILRKNKPPRFKWNYSLKDIVDVLRERDPKAIEDALKESPEEFVSNMAEVSAGDAGKVVDLPVTPVPSEPAPAPAATVSRIVRRRGRPSGSRNRLPTVEDDSMKLASKPKSRGGRKSNVASESYSGEGRFIILYKRANGEKIELDLNEVKELADIVKPLR